MQDNWRFCTKCYGLFWYGDPHSNGLCPQDGGLHFPFESDSPTHAGTSWDFALTIASQAPPPPHPGDGAPNSPHGTQGNWRFCTKCYGLFWYGYSTTGACPGGGHHSPFESDSPTHAGTSWDFALTIASQAPPPPHPGDGAPNSPHGTQGNWRFCTKCHGLFWYGYSTTGACPGGGHHSPFESDSPTHAGTSWDFALTIASQAPPPSKSIGELSRPATHAGQGSA